MSYKPPFARMRQIVASAPHPLPKGPQNVEEALLDMAKLTAQIVEPPEDAVEPEVEAPLTMRHLVPEDHGDIEVAPEETEDVEQEPKVVEAPLTVSPVADEPDDEIVIEAEEDIPEYSLDLSRKDLQVLAEKYGVEVKGTKAEIVAALDKHFGK